VVELQAANIQLTADLSVAEKERDHYKGLLKWEVIKSTVKDVLVLVAIASM
jgi:hypothetical protein